MMTNHREVINLAANESPFPPFSGVLEALRSETPFLNRYPDARRKALLFALAADLDVPQEFLWLGAGSTELLSVIFQAKSRTGSSVVYAWPSFVFYQMAAQRSDGVAVEVPLDDLLRHDLERMRSEIRDDTTLVCVCNPNNPTGTHVPAKQLSAFAESLPKEVLIVIDEAYHEYVSAEDHQTAIPLALRQPNVVVLRTFSKAYSLAGLRVGYAVGNPASLRPLRALQLPYAVNNAALVAAEVALAHREPLAQRLRIISTERAAVIKALRTRGIEIPDSQANFIFFRAGDPCGQAERILRLGVKVQPFPADGMRVTLGLPEENRRFLAAWDAVQKLSAGEAVPGGTPARLGG